MTKKDGKNGQGVSELRGNATQWGSKSKPIFIEGYLDANDQDWLQDHLADQLAYISELLQSLDEEYTLSCKYDTTSQRFMATLTCRVQDHDNTGRILVSRGSDTINALYALAYRHFIKYSGKWGGASGTSERLWD